jgi:hypothetical protein
VPRLLAVTGNCVDSTKEVWPLPWSRERTRSDLSAGVVSDDHPHARGLSGRSGRTQLTTEKS